MPATPLDSPMYRGLLGDDYPGYFPVRDEQALADLLLKAETDPEFLQDLESRVARLAARFTPDREQASLEQALALACQRCSERVGAG